MGSFHAPKFEGVNLWLIKKTRKASPSTAPFQPAPPATHCCGLESLWSRELRM